MMPRVQRPGLFATAPAVEPEREEIQLLHEQPGTVRIERIVSRGHTTPEGRWYDQDADEWVALLEGKAAIAYADGTTVNLVAGDWICIPAHCRHRVASTSSEPPAIWLAVHMMRHQTER